MANSSSSSSSGIGFCGLLAIVFVVLKLCEVIAWSWWWVLSPLWVPLAIVSAVLACIGLVTAAALSLKWAIEKCH